MTKNYEEMKVVELKELCRKAGIKGYSKMKKSELVDALNNSKEAKKAVINEARNFAKDELGKDFGRAVSFWKQLRDIKYMSANDYTDVVEKWRMIMSLYYIAEKEGVANRALSDSLAGTASMLRDIFCPDADISGYSEDELKALIENYLEEFSLSVFSKRLKKESTEIIKMSMDDIWFTEDRGIACFDSTKASKFTGKEVKVRKAEMRIVESSEDGISRMLNDKGLTSITVFMGKTSQDEEEMKLLKEAKKKIFRDGFFDVATGKHFMFAFQNPSSCRKANFMFVEAKDWNDVVALWLEITGIKDWEGFKKAFFDSEGKVVMAKLLARISTRGSNSFSIERIAPEYDAKIKSARVLYIPDAKQFITRPYKTLVAPGCMEMQEGKERKITPGDGQMIASIEFHATIAVAMRIISGNEYNDFCTLWHKAGRDMSKVKEGSRLYKLINKIPCVFQGRQVADKGISEEYNYENIEVVITAELAEKLNKLNKLNGEHFNEGDIISLGDYDILIPESVRKFIGGEWNEHPLEICNYLKKKNGWVALNPQFIQALDYENPNALLPIVKFWFNYMKEALTDIAKAQQFHGIIKSSDDEDNKTTASNLTAVLRVCSDLLDDAQVCNWRKDQFVKFINDMMIGRILVPGQYTYMIADPGFIIQNVFGTEVPHLASDEYYHNNKECQCGLFRSPLIHPFEAQKVQLVKNEMYWYMRDVIVFNGYDGAWDRMGGGDFDGDTCAVIPDDTEFGKLVVDGIRCIPFDIWEESQKAVMKEFTLTNFVNHLGDSAQPDRTGPLTNEQTKSMDISNHLKACVYFAKYYNCENITFIHPQAFGQDLGRKFQPQVQYVDGVRTFAVKGFVEAKWNHKAKQVMFAEHGMVGTYTFEEVLEKAEYYLSLVEIGRILQGREIDGAKTGVYAEGISGLDYIDAVKTKFTAHQMITRQVTLDKDVSKSAELNEYVSVSVLGRIHDYVRKCEPEILDYLNNGTNKIFLLQSLLSEKEAQDMGKLINMADGSKKSILDIVAIRKKMYNTKIYEVMKNLTGDDASNTLKNIRETEVDELVNLATVTNVSIETVASACYIVAYTKDSKQTEGLTYGWLLFDELLSVFSRGNKKFELFRLPASMDIKHVRIVDEVLYINGNKHININAEDCDNVVIDVINGRPYALIHKKVPQVVTQRTNAVKEYGTKVYTIGVYGFQYHIKGVENPKDRWKELVNENNSEFDVIMDAKGNAVLAIDGKSICALMPGANFDLNGKRVKRVVEGQEFGASIKDIQVVIIGDAQ